MKHCPECNVEYQEVALRCADCDVLLLAGSPVEEDQGDPDVTLECVYATCEPALIALIKSILGDAGIEYFAKGDDIQDLFGWGRFATPVASVVGPVEFFVTKDDAEAAREILARLEEPAPELPMEDEPGA